MISLFCFFDFSYANLWAFVTAVASIAVALIAYNELTKNRKIKSAEFINDFTSSFFTTKTNELLFLFEFDLIELIPRNKGQLKDLPDEYTFFKVIQPGYKRKDEIPEHLLENVNIYSPYEIEDSLLGQFEDMYLFLRKGVLDKDFVFDVFRYYIVAIGKNQQIQDYICQMREDYDDESLYKKFEDLIRITPKNEGFVGFKHSKNK